MAGEGGFSTKLNGFDKNEVNEYISKMSKEKQKLEQDLKEREDKLKTAVKIASEADEKIKAAKEESDKQIADLNAQVKAERKKSEELILQIDDLKRKLKNGGGKSSGSDANAEKRAEEIINSANAKARRIIADAEKKAAGMSAGAPARAAVDGEAFMAALKGFQTTISNEIQKLGNKASQILKTPAPSFAAAAAPAAAADPMSMDNGFFEDMDSDAPASDNMSGFEEMAASAAANEMDMSAPAGDMDMDMGAADDMNVAPLEPEKTRTEMTDDFGKELLEQTVPSSSLNDAMQDMFGGSGGLEINGGGDSVDFDMGGSDNSDNTDNSGGFGGNDAQSDIDAMNALLGQMSAGLESMSGSSDMEQPAEEPAASNASNDDNPWANLQAQLDAMEKSGDFGGDDSGSDSAPAPTGDAPQAPSADDSSIWDFGGSSDDSGSDDMSDDMSADLFGSF